jgi:hypothetical protein
MPESDRTSMKNPLRKPVSQSDGTTMEPAHDLADYLKEYARERPEVVALWCFGLGFIVGWKLKPW